MLARKKPDHVRVSTEASMAQDQREKGKKKNWAIVPATTKTAKTRMNEFATKILHVMHRHTVGVNARLDIGHASDPARS